MILLSNVPVVTIAVIFLLIPSSCKGQESLNPFISWSDNDVLMNIPQKDDINQLTKELSNQKIESIDVILIFISKKLSFDQLALSGQIFTNHNDTTFHYNDKASKSSTSSSNVYAQLKKTIETSRSYYWTGTRTVKEDDWMLNLANTLGRDLHYINVNDVSSLDKWKGIIVVDLPMSDTEDGSVIQSVMNEVQAKELSYLAIYTCSHDSTKYKNIQPRSIKDKRYFGQSIIVSDDSTSGDSSCAVGGVFNYTSGSPCLLFCMNQNVTFIPNVTNPGIRCALRVPYNVTWCCDPSSGINGSVSACQNETYPSVTIEYIVENITQTSSDGNICDKMLFQPGTFPERPDAPHFEDARPQIVVFLKFIFASSNTTSSNSWNLLINTTYSYLWHSEEDEEPAENEPPDEEEAMGIVTYSSLATRQEPSSKLYAPFSVGFGLSYSCASEEYNTYSGASSWNESTNASAVIIKGMQVQPFNVSSSEFGSSDNCVGYFTVTTWMGIVTVGTLIFILYVALVASFSITSLDTFEDPRNGTIKIEKVR